MRTVKDLRNKLGRTSPLIIHTREKYYSIISILTRYYPFSLLYRDRLFHAQNLPFRNFMDRLDKIALKSGLKMFFVSGENIGGGFSIFYRYPGTRPRNFDLFLNKLRRTYEAELQTVYVSEGAENIKVIVPTETVTALDYSK